MVVPTLISVGAVTRVIAVLRSRSAAAPEPVARRAAWLGCLVLPLGSDAEGATDRVGARCRLCAE
ncbi:MAG: hypothetical protein ACK5MT_15635 [Actinomycetales bacterium]